MTSGTLPRPASPVLWAPIERMCPRTVSRRSSATWRKPSMSSASQASRPGSVGGITKPSAPGSIPARTAGGSSSTSATAASATNSSRSIARVMAPGSRARRSVAAMAHRGVVDGGEAGEREGGEHEPEVAQRDVVEARGAQQVDHDAREPAGDEIGAVAGLEGDGDPGEDLDPADEVHEVLAGSWGDVVDPRRQVGGPVDQHVEE